MRKVSDELTLENARVLDLVQAMLSLISPDLRGVSLEMAGADVILHFAVANKDESILDDINEIEGEFLALRPLSSQLLRHEISVGWPDTQWSGINHRKVFLAKNPDDPW